VNAGVVSRPVEFRAVSEFLQSATDRAAAFVIQGEAGIALADECCSYAYARLASATPVCRPTNDFAAEN
jgi:hypothetical protein